LRTPETQKRQKIMGKNNNIVISRDDVNRVINCIKSLDVKGYDSMYRVVATVEFLEGKLSEPPVTFEQREKDHEFKQLG